MPIKLKANNGNIDLKVPIKQVGGGAVDSVNGMTGDVVLDIPSKTSDLVNDSGFLTEHQSLAEYAKKSELFSKDYNDLTNKPTIPSIDGLASTSYVDSKVAEIDVPTKTSDLINDSGFLTEHQSLADYAKKSEIPDVSGFLTSIPDEYVTETELDAKGYLTEHQSLAEYAKKSDIPDVSDYVTDTELNTAISSAEERVDFKLGSYALKTEVPSVEGLASTQYVDNKVSEIVVPSLDGYATEQWVEGKGYLTQHQSLADYATKSELATKQDTLTAGNNITIENGVISATGGSGGGSYTLPVADENTLGGVKVKQTDNNKQYGIVYIDSDARLRIPIARQGASENAGIVLPVNGQFRVEDNGDMFLRPASTEIGGVKPDGTTTTVDTDGTIHAVMPEPYTLPTATTTTLGGVKVDGTSITIADGVISSAAGGLIGKKMNSYNQPESEWTWIADWAQHPEKYYVVIRDTSGKDCPVIYTDVHNKYFYYYWFEGNTLHTRYITFTDNTLSQVESVSQYADEGTVWLTQQNWQDYVTAGGGSNWYVTTSRSESNLYNAKEVVIFWQDSNYNRHQTYLNVGCDYYGNSGNSWGSSQWINTQIRLDSVDSSNNGSSITYDGSNINTSDCTIEAICYKT